MVVVMKFGGSCFKDENGFKEVVERVKEHKGHKVLVTSAMYGVTNRLVETAVNLSNGENVDVYSICDELLNRHFNTLDALVSDEEIKERTRQILESELLRLRSILNSIFTLEELTPKTKDHVMSFGERLSTPLLEAALNDTGLKAKYFTGQRAGIVTDSKYGKAKPIYDITKKNVANNLQPLLKQNIIPIVTGFVAADAEGSITTLGRGGSDFTATLLGYSLESSEIWLWKDVDGFMTTDPKLVSNAKLLSKLSYEEAIELAYFGSRVIQAHAVEPAMKAGSAIWIKNFQNSKSPGTIICGNGTKKGVKAVSMWKDIVLVDVVGSGKASLPVTISKIFKKLSLRAIETVMFSQGASEIGISLIIPKEQLQDALLAINDVKEEGIVSEVIVKEDMCVIAVVGKDLRSTPGIAGTVFTALGKRDINVYTLARGASDYTFSFLIRGKSGVDAIKAIHTSFNLGKGD